VYVPLVLPAANENDTGVFEVEDVYSDGLLAAEKYDDKPVTLLLYASRTTSVITTKDPAVA